MVLEATHLNEAMGLTCFLAEKENCKNNDQLVNQARIKHANFQGLRAYIEGMKNNKNKLNGALSC